MFLGIDPAGPGFFENLPNRRLHTNDAKYVQAIHTNAGLLGISFPVGHSDFWPNGGKVQPGCLLGICCHNRVYSLYTESLGTNGFLATKCNSYSNYKRGACKNEENSRMGGLYPNTK